ncbi:MAG: helix-turn-helix domain-containing protein [bacterium]
MQEKALTVKQIATYLQVNERTIYKLAQSSNIPCFKVAGTWRFWKKDIEDWSRNTHKKK